MGNDYGKTRLYSPILSKTNALPRCARHHSALQGRPSPPRRGDESAGKRSHRNRSSSPEQVRLLQPLIPRPQKRWRPASYSRSQTPELCPDEKVVQVDYFYTDPFANMSRGLVHVSGSERRVLSHPGSPPSQTILEICIQRGGISIQCPAVWAVPGSPHLYTMHGCVFLPSAIDGNPHTQQPRRLAHSGPVAGGFNIAQDPSPQPLRLPGAKGQLCQEHTVTQPAIFVPGHSYRLSADDSNCLSGASRDNSGLTSGFFWGATRSSTNTCPPSSPKYTTSSQNYGPLLVSHPSFSFSCSHIR